MSDEASNEKPRSLESWMASALRFEQYLDDQLGDGYIRERLALRDARIAELKAEVELHMNGAARVASRAQKAEAQRDLLAEALRSLTESAKAYMNYHGEKFYPASPDQVGGLWPAIRKAGGVLAELEEKR